MQMSVFGPRRPRTGPESKFFQKMRFTNREKEEMTEKNPPKYTYTYYDSKVVVAGCGFQDCDRTTTTHGQQRAYAIDLDRGSGVKQFQDFFFVRSGCYICGWFGGSSSGSAPSRGSILQPSLGKKVF